jgi:hypothetical protein
MPDAAHHQSSFIGGEWSPVSQGRSHLPGYGTAMRVCLNGLPLEEESWTRRSGFEFIIPTRSGLPAKLLPFYTTVTHLAYTLEFTDAVLRFFVGSRPVMTTTHPTVTASSLAAGILSLTATTTGIIVGDDVMLWAPDDFDPALIGPWRGRVMRVKTVGGGIITVGDEAGNAFVGLTSAANALVNCKIYQLDREATQWTGQSVLQALRIVPTDTTACILAQTISPKLLDVAATPRLVDYPFFDGPYLDQQGTVAAPEAGTLSSRTAGSVTFTPSGSTTFDANDVNRIIRFFTEPPAWASGTTYAYGDVVTYDGAYWTSIAAGNLGIIPGTTKTSGGVQLTVWAPAAVGGDWTWGTITAQATSSCTVTMVYDVPPGNSLTVKIWRLGVYKGPNQFPTCGIYYEGRLILGGAVPNRWDASRSNQPLVFSPTNRDGTVEDDCGISYVLTSDDPQPIAWFKSDSRGLLLGTLTSEWLVASSTLNEALTPTSVKATQVTKYGSINHEPVRAGLTLVFVQRYGQRLMELLPMSSFAPGFTGRHVNENAKHISTAGITEIAYQEEKVPVIWCRLGDGGLAGCTYRRVGPYSSDNPIIEGWHRQVLGGNYNGDIERKVVSMTVRTDENNLSDLLYVCTTDTSDEHAWIEVLRPIFEDA